ncbi:MAG: SPOR domain-containing protein [Pleurocapsa sp.]
MTIKSLSLTKHSLLPQYLSTCVALTLTILLAISGSSLIMVAFPAPAIAEDEPQITEALPPPPPISQPNQIIKNKYTPIVPLDTNPPSYSSDRQREYTFSAPDVPFETQKNRVNLGYRVEVFGNTERLLTQVRDIEPKAFQKGSIIQVGIFSDRHNAEDLVRKLAIQGLWSRIVVNN